MAIWKHVESSALMLGGLGYLTWRLAEARGWLPLRHRKERP